MATYAAFLRGIGPGNPNMTNDKLRGVFADLGFTGVASVLASGNIVFRTTETDLGVLEGTIQDALHEQLGIPGRTIVRHHDVLRALLDSGPFGGLTHGRATYLTVTFLQQGVEPVADGPDQDDPRVRVVRFDRPSGAYLWVTDNSGTGTAPAFMSWLEATYRQAITTRSWLTIQRIVRKIEG